MDSETSIQTFGKRDKNLEWLVVIEAAMLHIEKYEINPKKIEEEEEEKSD